jgi:hypothetical protein
VALKDEDKVILEESLVSKEVEQDAYLDKDAKETVSILQAAHKLSPKVLTHKSLYWMILRMT